MFELQNLKAEVARKADSWEVDNLSNEITQLKNQVQQLSEKLDQAYSMIAPDFNHTSDEALIAPGLEREQRKEKKRKEKMPETENKVRVSKEIRLCKDCPQHYVVLDQVDNVENICRQMPGLDRKIGFQFALDFINEEFLIPDVCPKLNAKNAIRRDEGSRT